jgi:hypothetical protein
LLAESVAYIVIPTASFPSLLQLEELLSPVLKERLTQVKNFLWLYTDTHDDGTTHPANPVGSHWSQAAD